MTDEKVRRFHGERGAALILAIAFMVIVGAISAAVLATTTSGLQARVALDKARNREYAADAAIEQAITTARNNSGVCPSPPTTLSRNSVNIRVDCSAALVAGPNGLLLSPGNLLVFAACLDGTGACSPAGATNPPIVTAQVNFQGSAPMNTFVQAWSVNG